jgi:sporulation protein YtfJ
MDQRQHPIEQIMETTLENLKQMIDVNTIVGDSVVMADGTVIVPVSKVNLGFVSGGGEYPGKKQSAGKQNTASADNEQEAKLPFAGGAGAGVSISPMAFLVASSGKIQLMPVEGSTPYDRLAELIPRIFAEIRDMIRNPQQDDYSVG